MVPKSNPNSAGGNRRVAHQPSRHRAHGPRAGHGGASADGPPRPRRSAALGLGVGIVLGAAAIGAISWGSGCRRESSPPAPAASASTRPDPIAALPEPPPMVDDSAEPEVPEPDLPDAGAPDAPYTGPWLGAMAHATPIYPTARFSRNRIGYIRRGGKVPVVDKPIKTKSCRKGFFPLVDGGYVCGKYATTNLEHPRVKHGVKPPDLEGLLPYRYAFNRSHGTPLYAQLPSAEQMLLYEPYLVKKKKPAETTTPVDKPKPAEAAAVIAAKADQPRPNTDNDAANAAGGNAPAPLPSSSASATKTTASPPPSASASPAPPLDDEYDELDEGDGGAAAAPPEKPWWQAEKDEPIDVKLSDLEESDGTLAKRMVKGFFIAIDRTLGAHKRLFYQTTGGLFAPSDRLIIPKTPTLTGMAMTDEIRKVGFIRWRKGSQYKFDGDKPKRIGPVPRFTAFGLTGETKLYKKTRYRETFDGWWMKGVQGTFTDPGPRPSEVGPQEKWIDVNLSRKTLVAFVGDKPVYAALIAPGKRSKNKKRDHRTKTGQWRVREKHITTTMDGDGVAGDLPYSIQDVPFVQYYDGSYALHGAFWHHNFGNEQSHGCVNLAPADAKHLFFWTEPPVPRGWHGTWSSAKRKGTLIVVHE